MDSTQFKRVECKGTQLPGFTRESTYRALYVGGGFKGFIALEWSSRDANVSAVALRSKPVDLTIIDYSAGYFGFPVSHGYAAKKAIEHATAEGLS